MKHIRFMGVCLLLLAVSAIEGSKKAELQKYPFDFFQSLESFETEVLGKPASTEQRFQCLALYLWIQCWLEREKAASKKPSKDELVVIKEKCDAYNLDVSLMKDSKDNYYLEFKTTVLLVATRESQAAKDAAPFLGKEIKDDLEPSPVLEWLASTKGGDENVQTYLNLVLLYILQGNEIRGAKKEDIPGDPAKLLAKFGEDAFAAGDFNQIDQVANKKWVKETLFAQKKYGLLTTGQFTYALSIMQGLKEEEETTTELLTAPLKTNLGTLASSLKELEKKAAESKTK